MKRVVLVSGYGYDWPDDDARIVPQYDFAKMARNYANRKFNHGESCTLFNFMEGQIEYREGSGRFKQQKDYKGHKLVGISTSMYGETLRIKDKEVFVFSAFKKKQKDVLSIVDVYDYVKNAGSGSIIELSFFAHSYNDGPVLVNSYNQSPFPSVRDLDDKDPRMEDFTSNDQWLNGKTEFGDSFAPTGAIYIKGCNVDICVRSIIRQLAEMINRKFAVRSKVTIRDISQDLEKYLGYTESNRGIEPAAGSIRLGRPYEYTSGKHKETVVAMQTTIESMLYALYANLLNTYAYKVAAATKVQTYGAVPGVGAEIDEPGYPPMYVSNVYQPILDFYRKQFKMKFEKNNYASFMVKDNYPDQMNG